ncbi:MAG: cytochrome c oxidase subunit II [Granulosicoccaceae bacterium]|jgi:cytochrome c oxidase subunit 2
MVMVSGTASADYTLNLRQGVTEVSNNGYDLHMIILWICTIVGAGVFAVMIYSLMNHTKAKNPTPATFHENHKLEIVWTLIPFVILVGMAIPATSALLKLEDTRDADMTIKVTGYQWKWHYEYMDGDAEGVKYFSSLATPRDQIENKADKGENYLLEVDNRLVIPKGKKVRFLMTANDVIHNWWVPDFGFKKDAIPGYINESWARAEQTGTYRGQCAELCGKDHGFMPIVVDVVEEADYLAWAEGQKAQAAADVAAAGKAFSKDELMARGEKVYNANCAACHQANGQGLPGVFPALAGGPIATGPAAGHIDIVVHGSKKNPAMAAFGAQLNDVDLAAVITFERNSWGNDAGVVQPADVKAAR